MRKLQHFLVVLSLALAPALFAQSADQAITASDSMDPVVPGVNYTYTINLQNNGPNAATNGGVNISLDGTIEPVSVSASPGFTCTALSQFMTCSTPSFASGATATVTLTARVPSHRLNFPDGTVSAIFTTSGTTPDPVNGNNSATVTTGFDSPQVDLQVTASGDPATVTPGQNVTYTATVTNAGPDTATDATFHVAPNSSLTFQSVTTPAGWTCPAPQPGLGFTCTRASVPSGTTSVFTVVFKADLGPHDTPFTTFFMVGGTGDDTNDGNNSTSVTTQYVAPDADITVSVTDSPDPVFPKGQITYTATVTNVGPDPGTNAVFTVYNSSGLGFVSVTAPDGWTCTPPAPGQFVQFSCTTPSLAVGAPAVFTVVATTDTVYYGSAEGTILTSFSAGSAVRDPVDNNAEVESTAYVTPDADLSILATDSPDPVDRGENITYTVTLANAGPDTAAATLNVPMNGTLKFVSQTVPAGFICTGVPAAGAAATYSCTDTTFESGASAVFTIVLNVDPNAFGINDGTIVQSFTVTGNVTDPDNDDNTAVVTTAYDPATSEVGVTVTDSPDPVNAGSNLTYTGTFTNAGPDAATGASLLIPLNPNLLFQSITGPAGFTCTTPAVGANGTITCTNASVANGASIPFTLVTQVNPSLASGPDGLIEQTFFVGSENGDPTPANNELDVFTAYVTPDADLSATNSDTPDPVAPGGVITYTQTITNNGPDTATTVTFTETLPASVGFVSIAQTTGPTFTCTTPAVGASGTITCSIASLTSGTTATFTVVVDVIATSGTVGNTVVVDAFTFDPDTNDNAASTSTTILAASSADLSLTKSTNTTLASPGTDIVYTIVLTNSGPNAATTVVLTDTLPAQLQFRSITEPAGFDCVTPAVGASGTITCTAATLANGATATFTLTARVAPGATSGSITNTASVASATGDPDNTDTSGSSGGVTLAPSAADLSITKSTTATNATAGSNFTYTIVVSNAGPNAASTVTMTDVLPAQLQFVSITTPAGFTCTTPAVNTNGTITCNAASLASGANATFTLTVRVTPTATGSFTNTATASSPTADPDNGDRSSTSTGVTITAASADLSIVKNTASTTQRAGSTFSYTIAVSNAGPNAASNVVMTDVLPAQLLFQSITAPAGFTCTTPAVGANGTITCNGASLASGATATFTLNVRVASNASTGTVTNSATVTSATGDPDNTDTTDAAPPVTLAPASADLSIAKTTSSAFAPTGSTLTYAIVVTNSGPSAATNVVVSDTIPAGLQFVSATPSQGTCSGTTTVTCNLGTINNGATATISLQTLVTATSGTVSNTATVTSPVSDPDEGDQASTTPPIPVGEPADVEAIPTLSEWALIAFAAMLGLLAMTRMRS